MPLKRESTPLWSLVHTSAYFGTLFSNLGHSSASKDRWGGKAFVYLKYNERPLSHLIKCALGLGGLFAKVTVGMCLFLIPFKLVSLMSSVYYNNIKWGWINSNENFFVSSLKLHLSVELNFNKIVHFWCSLFIFVTITLFSSKLKIYNSRLFMAWLITDVVILCEIHTTRLPELTSQLRAGHYGGSK